MSNFSAVGKVPAGYLYAGASPPTPHWGESSPQTPAMETGIGESVMDLFDEGVFPRSLRWVVLKYLQVVTAMWGVVYNFLQLITTVYKLLQVYML